MTEEKNDQQCCGSEGDDNQQGCCSSSGDGKCFNWQKFIFIAVVIAACAVAAHSFLANGSGTCPITGKCGSDITATCSDEPADEASACCPSERPAETTAVCPSEKGDETTAACCPSEKLAETTAVCPSGKGAEGAAVCPITGAKEGGPSPQ
jgi:hypothetical protein